MKPVDPRLLRRAAPARRYLSFVVIAGVLTAGLVVAQATLLAHLIVHARLGVTALRGWLVVLLIVVACRGLLAYLGEVGALRAAAAVRSSFRRDLAATMTRLGPAWADGERAGSVSTLMTHGLESLDDYFARYLPQLVLAAVVPLVVLVRLAGADLLSAFVVGLTIPLIPVFMILVGMHTKARTDRQWQQMSMLGGHFFDVVEGLSTLKVFGRAKAQVANIRAVSNDFRRTTMRTLRVAFLSSLVLELLATLATAVVAVEVGLRLLNGHLSYQTALLVLLLTPEAYLPLRAVGASFHASADGVAAVTQALEILELEPASTTRPDRIGVDLRRDPIELAGVSVCYPGRLTNALDRVDLTIRPGERVALVGASGAGKSTLLAVLLGLVVPTSGGLRIGGRSDAVVDDLRTQIAWVPQMPHVFSGTIADNLRIGAPHAHLAAIRQAAARSGLDQVVAGLPDGYDTILGDRGHSLSTGQRQRLALARAFLRDAAVLLLDEPAAHLDDESATELRAAVAQFAIDRTLVVISHEPVWLELADRVVTLAGGTISSDRRAQVSVAS